MTVAATLNAIGSYQYCGRFGPGLFDEPLNALTNLAFLLAALWAWRAWRAQGGGGSWPPILFALVASIGVGSFVFHSVPTPATLVGDFVPIQVFGLAFLAFVARTQLRLSRGATLGLALAFLAAWQLWIAATPRAALGGGIAYLPALAALAAAAWLVRRTGAALWRPMAGAAVALAAALAVRAWDLAVCPAFPWGLHWAWHLLAALAAGLLAHGVAVAPPGSATAPPGRRHGEVADASFASRGAIGYKDGMDLRDAKRPVLALETFVWDDLFVTGLDTVDEQHRRLVDLVNELSASFITGQDTDDAALQLVVARLADYANYHFAEEERLMAEVGVHPRHVEHHQATHRKFVEQVGTMWDSRHTMSEPATVILEFLIAWLSFHILGEDQALARQIKRIRAGQTPAQALDAEEAPRDRMTAALLHALRNLYRVLSQQNRDLAAANQNLEARVGERTRELEIANLRLELASRTDGLLNIANRMYFDERFASEWRRARREGQALALLMIDVDFFKRYNDTYGHQAGDACLRSVVQAALTALRRPADLLARYGGEEIVALLPSTDLPGALLVGSAIQAELAALNIPHAASDAADRVTISIGAASLRPGADNEPAQLLAAADAALYEAKGRGRNQIQCAAAGAAPRP